MSDGTGLAEALLGLDGFRVVAVTETDAEVVIEIETTATVVGCSACGTRAEAHERMPVAIRDLACFGRPARLVCADGGGAVSSRTATPRPGPRPRLSARAGRC